jgi:hypothetical protein
MYTVRGVEVMLAEPRVGSNLVGRGGFYPRARPAPSPEWRLAGD